MLNLGSKTLMPETTLYSPGRVYAEWLSYWPGLSLLQTSNSRLVFLCFLIDRLDWNMNLRVDCL